jgi:sensor histidine kinase regulating citrate/malate metabolism
VKLGTLAVDGTKLKANASKHKAMSYARMKSEEQRLREEIKSKRPSDASRAM